MIAYCSRFFQNFFVNDPDTEQFLTPKSLEFATVAIEALSVYFIFPKHPIATSIGVFFAASAKNAGANSHQPQADPKEKSLENFGMAMLVLGNVFFDSFNPYPGERSALVVGNIIAFIAGITFADSLKRNLVNPSETKSLF